MNKEQIIALAKKHWHRDQWNIEYFDVEAFYHAAIESYKAELLKEAWEPVWAVPSRIARVAIDHVATANYDERISAAHKSIRNNEKLLFTSDQVVAAVFKATKPLEDENNTLRRIHKENIDILVKELSDKDYEYNQKTNRLIERHTEQIRRRNDEVNRRRYNSDSELPDDYEVN